MGRLTKRLLDNTPGRNPWKVELLALGKVECGADDGCSDDIIGGLVGVCADG